MPKSRIRLRVQLISRRGSNDVALWLARREAARVLDEEVGDERAAPGIEATADVAKDQDPVPRGARAADTPEAPRSVRTRRRPARSS
jgi:hypothetical protein